MHIIFGKDEAQELENKYTVLELDLFQIGQEGPTVPAYCVIENIGILDLPKLDSMKRLHNNLLNSYRNKQWQYCKDALEHLLGFWGGELDTFYNDLAQRVDKHHKQDPGPDWSPVIIK